MKHTKTIGNKKMLAWIGTICGIIGSVLVAANNGFQFVGYVSFLIGALACLITAIKRKDVIRAARDY